ncbi:MAG: GAF domain-containing protein [Verrucomicrobia bacterium]|nr:GAF domain-containing protein [Verrucomicrobiota bacterium]
MTRAYYWLILLNAATSFAAAGAVFWRNRPQIVGPLFGATMMMVGVWLLGYAHYFLPLSEPAAWGWAKVTLSAALLGQPVWFHTLCAMAERERKLRWWVAACYASTLPFLCDLWFGNLITGLKTQLYMDHYVRYDRAWYPVLGLELVVWQWVGIGIAAYSAWHTLGYKRTQLVYFIVAWAIVFVTNNFCVLPLEYEINMQPFAFFLLPLNLAFLAYVMAKARLADFNIVIARVLLVTITLMIIVGVGFLVISASSLIAPGFMGTQQTLFTLALLTAIGLALATSLPRFLPRAERLMQQRFFGAGSGYQAALSSLAKELGRLPSIDQVFASVSTTLHYQMQVSHVAIFFENPHSGTYQLQAQSGLASPELAAMPDLPEDSPLVRWLVHQKDTLVRDEMPRLMDGPTQFLLTVEMERLKAWVCVPMFLEEKLAGWVALGQKINRDMFFGSDVKLLENLAAEVGLAVKYRHMEEEISRKNRLVDLGTIAAGVAHEIRNPLASVRTFAQLLPERIDDKEFREEFSKLVLKDVDRISKVVESMLAFARPSQVSVSDNAATDLLDEAVLLVQSRLKSKSVHLVKEYHQQPTLKVDKQQMLQVLVNLLINAVDAVGQNGEIRVTTGVRRMDTGEGNHRRHLAVLEITDNGAGIPAAVRNRLFDPFFTTKKDGTGLGLSISQKIARDHGGIITVSSVEGKGTTFRVNLPLS